MTDDRYKVQVLNALTGEEYERDMTPEEIAAIPKATDENSLPALN
jgi:hypothetical protein